MLLKNKNKKFIHSAKIFFATYNENNALNLLLEAEIKMSQDKHFQSGGVVS